MDTRPLHKMTTGPPASGPSACKSACLAALLKQAVAKRLRGRYDRPKELGVSKQHLSTATTLNAQKVCSHVKEGDVSLSRAE